MYVRFKQKVISIAIHGSRFTVASANEDLLFVLTICFSGVLRIERGSYSPFRIHLILLPCFSESCLRISSTGNVNQNQERTV